MNKLTACLIVKNEEDFIARCIENLLEVCDEVIITDTGSTDKTKDICKSYNNVKVFDYEWNENFSDARNDGLKYATGDWILFIGADEILSKNIIKNLPILLSKTYPDNTVFCFNVLNPSSSGITTSYFRQALFKNNKGIKFFRPIHEQLNIEKGNLINFNCPDMEIIHFNKLKKEENLTNKYDKYIKILNSAISTNVDENDNYYYYHHLGNAYAQKNDHKKAYESFLKSYELYNQSNFDKNTLAYGTILIKLISELVLYSDIKNQAQKYIDEILQISPDFTDALFYQEIILQENRNFEKALEIARKLYFYLVEGKYNNPLGIVSQGLSILPNVLIDLASLSYINGFREDAGRIAERSSKLFPENTLVSQYLANYYLLSDDYFKSIYYFNKSFDHNILNIKNIDILINEPKKFIRENELGLQIEMLEFISKSNIWNIVEKEIILSKIIELKDKLNPKISVCLITKNEEDCLERCLNSIKDLAYEILITDTGSTDKTKEIANKYGKVFDYVWENDFSKARNKSIENAIGDWILWIDADEVIDNKSKLNLLELIKNTPYKDKSIVFCLKNLNFSTTGSVDTSYFKQNLFKNKKGIKFTSPIHEFLVCENEKLISEDCENISITHFETLKSKDRLISKHHSYISILKQIIETNSRQDYYYYLHLANSLVYVERLDEAIENYKKAYELSKNTKNNISENILKIILKELIFIHSKYNEGLLFIEKTDFIDNEILYLKAFALQQLSNIKNAIEIYENILVNEFGDLRKIILLELSKCYSLLGNKNKEIEVLNTIFELDKDFYPVLFRLIKFYLLNDDLSEAINILSFTKRFNNEQIKKLKIKSMYEKNTIEYNLLKITILNLLYDSSLDESENKQIEVVYQDNNCQLYEIFDDLIISDDYDKIFTYCDELLLLDNSSIVGLFYLALYHIKKNDLENSNLLFEYIINIIDTPKNDLEKKILDNIRNYK